MISRRPNSRASIEYAPGPRMARAKSIANPKINPSRESKPPEEQIGRTLIAVSIATIPPPMPANVVRKPAKRRPPARIPKTLATQTTGLSAASGRQAPSRISIVKPTVVRSNKSAIPGSPTGNEQHERCNNNIPLSFRKSSWSLPVLAYQDGARCESLRCGTLRYHDRATGVSTPVVNPKLLDIVMIRTEGSRILWAEE